MCRGDSGRVGTDEDKESKGGKMPVSSLFRASPIATVSQSHRPVTPIRRRAPIIGALCVLSIGTLTALAYRTWCPQPHRRVSLLRTKFVNQVSAQANFTRMSASAIVPSIVVYVTVPNHEAGKKLSESIINEKLAACVNIVPGIQSIYWWDGKVQTDSEELLIIKTRESLLNPLTEHIKANHEYEVPEVIALPINGGNDKYLEWIKNSTRDN